MLNPIAIIKYLKIGGIVLSILGIIGAGYKVYQWHLDEIDQAVNTKVMEMALEQQEIIRIREGALREISRKEREELEATIAQERARVSDLQRMLLIDHDLDRLLQRKPGMILKRVNEGTEQYFKDLEEATQ